MRCSCFEAAEYASSMLVGRINMHRLSSITENMILEERGCDREKGCLPMNDTRDNNRSYKQYLENQRQFR